MKQKHTKGPWKVSKFDTHGKSQMNLKVLDYSYNNGNEVKIIDKERDSFYALVGGRSCRADYGALFAAAPALLAAAREAEKLLADEMDEAEALEHATDGHDAESCILCQLREAIALAGQEGETDE